ncbi:hypothetical protein C7C46_33480, partial [Streptomyces tateyamensis]
MEWGAGRRRAAAGTLVTSGRGAGRSPGCPAGPRSPDRAAAAGRAGPAAAGAGGPPAGGGGGPPPSGGGGARWAGGGGAPGGGGGGAPSG